MTSQLAAKLYFTSQLALLLELGFSDDMNLISCSYFVYEFMQIQVGNVKVKSRGLR